MSDLQPASHGYPHRIRWCNGIYEGYGSRNPAFEGSARLRKRPALRRSTGGVRLPTLAVVEVWERVSVQFSFSNTVSKNAQ